MGRLNRLHQVRVESGLAGPPVVFGKAVAGERDKPRRMTGLARSPGELIAVEPGEADVDQRDVRVQSAQRLEAPGPSLASCTSCPVSSRRNRSISRLSGLSSTMRIRRAPNARGASTAVLLVVGAGICGSSTTKVLP